MNVRKIGSEMRKAGVKEFSRQLHQSSPKPVKKMVSGVKTAARGFNYLREVKKAVTPRSSGRPLMQGDLDKGKHW